MPTDRELFNQSHLKLKFIGNPGLEKLEQSKVLVIGAGGLGCPCLLALTGCGVGTIGIADFDTISLTNLHRQTLYHFSDVNKKKTSVAIEALKNRNPFISYPEHDIYVDQLNIVSLIKGYDVVVDATDNFLIRYLINDACVLLDKPLVYGAIYQEEGHVTVFNYQKSPTLRCLFPEAEENTAIPSCAEIGAYTITTNIIGTMMANEVVKVLLNSRDLLKGELLYFDAATGKTRLISYYEKTDSREKSISRFHSSEVPVEVSPEEYLDKQDQGYFKLIDVREEEERNDFNIGGDHLPLQDLLSMDLSRFESFSNYLFYCETGIRSQRAASFLREKGIKRSFSLTGGLNYLQNYL